MFMGADSQVPEEDLANLSWVQALLLIPEMPIPYKCVNIRRENKEKKKKFSLIHLP